MTRISLALAAFVTLSVACAPKRVVLPDPRIPHRLAKETKAVVWVRLPDGKLAEQEVRFQAGDYCAAAQVVEEP